MKDINRGDLVRLADRKIEHFLTDGAGNDKLDENGRRIVAKTETFPGRGFDRVGEVFKTVPALNGAGKPTINCHVRLPAVEGPKGQKFPAVVEIHDADALEVVNPS